MAYKTFAELIASLSTESGNKKCAAVAAPRTKNVMEAVLRAASENVIDFVLVGDEKQIRTVYEEIVREAPAAHIASLDADVNGETGHVRGSSNVRIVQADGDEAAARETVRLVRSGECDFIMKGSLETSVLLKEAVNKETGIGKNVDGGGNAAVMFHMMLVEIPSYHKLLGVTDGGMIITPTFEQKRAMVHEATEMFRRLGVECPNVACLAAVEKINPKMPETEDGAELKKLALSGEFGKCNVEGPVSTDLAFSKEAAALKKYESPVTGETDIVLVPNIATGNIMVKSLVAFAGAKTAGCILGAKAPISLTSRGATAEEEYNALMFAAAQA